MPPKQVQQAKQAQQVQNPQNERPIPPMPQRMSTTPLSRPWSARENEGKFLDGRGFFPIDSWGQRLECYHEFGSCTEDDPAIYYSYPFRDSDRFFRFPEQRQWIEKEFQEVCKVAGLKCMVFRREPHHIIARRDEEGYVVYEFDRTQWRWKHGKARDRWHSSVLMGNEFRKCLLQGHIYIRKIYNRANGPEGTPLKCIDHPEFGRIPPGDVPLDSVPLIEVSQGQDYWDPDDPWCMQFWLTRGTEIVTVRPADTEPQPPPYAGAPPLAPDNRGFEPPPPPPGVTPEVWQPVVAPWYQPPPWQPQPPAQNLQNPEQPVPGFYYQIPPQMIQQPQQPPAHGGTNFQIQQQHYLQAQYHIQQLQAAQQQAFIDPFASPEPQVSTNQATTDNDQVEEPEWTYDQASGLWFNADQTLAEHSETGVQYEIVDGKYYTTYNRRQLEYDPVFFVHRDVHTMKCYAASVVNGVNLFTDAYKPAGAFGEEQATFF